MDIREFLAPEWKKFILPVIFIVVFLLFMNIFYRTGSVIDKYGCELVSDVKVVLGYAKEMEVYREQNNTLALNETASRVQSLYFDRIIPMANSMQKDVESIFPGPSLDVIRVSYPVIGPFLYAGWKMDPFVPLPCEYGTEACGGFYMNKETFDCFKSYYELTGEGLFYERGILAIDVESDEYRAVSPLNIGMNVVLLFLEGYLLSCLIIFARRKALPYALAKVRKQKAAAPETSGF